MMSHTLMVSIVLTLVRAAGQAGLRCYEIDVALRRHFQLDIIFFPWSPFLSLVLFGHGSLANVAGCMDVQVWQLRHEQRPAL